MKRKNIIVGLALLLGTCLPAWARQTPPLEVVLHADQVAPAINPFIYGQFIEHLGRCIYGGIWAEMLEDRKFYFPVKAEYDPYTSLQGHTLSRRRRLALGDHGARRGVTMTSEDPFVGEHSPRAGGLGRESVSAIWGSSRTSSTRATSG